MLAPNLGPIPLNRMCSTKESSGLAVLPPGSTGVTDTRAVSTCAPAGITSTGTVRSPSKGISEPSHETSSCMGASSDLEQDHHRERLVLSPGGRCRRPVDEPELIEVVLFHADVRGAAGVLVLEIVRVVRVDVHRLDGFGLEPDLIPVAALLQLVDRPLLTAGAIEPRRVAVVVVLELVVGFGIVRLPELGLQIAERGVAVVRHLVDLEHLGERNLEHRVAGGLDLGFDRRATRVSRFDPLLARVIEVEEHLLLLLGVIFGTDHIEELELIDVSDREVLQAMLDERHLDVLVLGIWLSDVKFSEDAHVARPFVDLLKGRIDDVFGELLGCLSRELRGVARLGHEIDVGDRLLQTLFDVLLDEHLQVIPVLGGDQVPRVALDVWRNGLWHDLTPFDYSNGSVRSRSTRARTPAAFAWRIPGAAVVAAPSAGPRTSSRPHSKRLPGNPTSSR